MTTDTLLQQRARTHGDFSANARFAQQLRALFRTSSQWAAMSNVKREALDNIALKLSRALTHPDNDDTWKDIAGYATLAERDCVD
ncbi:MAG: DUF6378 domain-containing protein [Rhodospirillaceae bacterium]